MATKWLMRALHHHRALADHSFTGKANALLKPVQELDTINPWGKRSVYLTANPALLEGFPLNIGTTLEAIVRTPFTCEFSRTSREIVNELPRLIPGINFYPPSYHPVFSLVIGAGILPDLHCQGKQYTLVNEAVRELPAVATETPWYSTTEETAPLSLTLRVPDEFIQGNTSVVITVGIKFGRILPNGTSQQIKNAGAATIRVVR